MDQTATTPIEVWNQIIAPKYIRFRHIMVDGLATHGRAALTQEWARPLEIRCSTSAFAVLATAQST